MLDQNDGTVETRAEAERNPVELVTFWMQQLSLASDEENDWRKGAEEAIEIYSDTKARTSQARARYFNILYANVQTLSPAIYNSPPEPDVRRRFGDADPVGRVASQVLERGLSYAVDEFDVDVVLRAAVLDSLLPGRAVARIRYTPEMAGEQLVDQTLAFETVHWQDFRHGPARVWADVPWIAFRHWMTREELATLAPDLADKVGMSGSLRPDDKDKDAKRTPDVFKRACVWEIWDRERREVLFISDGYADAPLLVEPDPLGLKQFYPIAAPLYDVPLVGTLVPVEPYRLYKDQAEELDRVTRRITALIEVMKARGLYSGELAAITRLNDLKDGEFAPLDDAVSMAAMAAGGLDKAIWMMPIEALANVLATLYEQRDQIKQVIYEITGISDILRGQTDAGETATAQGIKAQWGSLRLQDRQREAQRFARDLLRLAGEIIAEKFEPAALQAMTGIELPDEAAKAQAMMAVQQGDPNAAQILETPTWNEVVALLRDDALRCYRVDIETDSTIRSDVARSQQNISLFLQGFGAFVTSIGPAVQAGLMPMDVVSDLLTAFARPFKLGRQAEDALERLSKVQPPPPPGPTPEQMAVESKNIDAENKKADASVIKAQTDVQVAQIGAEKAAMEMQMMAAMPAKPAPQGVQ